MPNASVGIDRLRAILRRARSGPSTGASPSDASPSTTRSSAPSLTPSARVARFHRRAIRWVVGLRQRFSTPSLEPRAPVAVVHLARQVDVEVRIEIGTLHPGLARRPDARMADARPLDDPLDDRPGPSRRPAGAPPPLPAPGIAPGPDGPPTSSSAPTATSLAPARLAPRSARRAPAARPQAARTRLHRSIVSPTAALSRGLPALEHAGRGLLRTARRGVEHERAAAATVAAILVLASFASALPAFGGPPTGDVGGPGSTPRLVIGGGVLGPPMSDTSNGDGVSGPNGWSTEPLDGEGLVGAVDSGVPVDAGLGAGSNGASPEGATDPLARLADPEASAGSEQLAGPFLADGTLLKPVAVDTQVPDARDRIVLYRVQSGDTLTGIARRFGISMMTLWWANDLKSKDDLHVGQVLRIPPVDGLVVTVQDGDTLDTIATKTGVSKETIAAFNGLTDDGLVVGQTLIVPGARGAPIPTPKPTPRPVTRTTGGTVSGPSGYGGGAFAWPVVGGHISQYYHYSHPAIDIAADYGTPVRAAAGGTVVFAGWKSNGGGYQVWISHGSGLYTGYYHLSAISVGRGQAVGRGQTIGRIGTSGWATGPHLHFEVWRGYPWEAGSTRDNPLRYF